MKTTKINLVGRAFGRVTSSKKAIDTLISRGFKKVREHDGKSIMIKQFDHE